MLLRFLLPLAALLSQEGLSLPFGATICTGTNPSFPYVIPSECSTHDGMTASECQAVQTIWSTKFAYCCPLLAASFPSSPKLQWGIHDPQAAGPFFRGINTYGVQPAKWVRLFRPTHTNGKKTNSTILKQNKKARQRLRRLQSQKGENWRL